MSLEELRSITPRQFFLMVERLKGLDRPRDRTVEIMVGQLLAMVGNIGYTELEKPMQPQDFMPSVWAEKEAAKAAKPKRKRRPSRKKITAMWRRTMEQAKAYQDEQVRRGLA